MIDIHCHILPGMDDGPADFEESLEMAKIAWQDGITKIIATPHIYDKSIAFADIVEKVDQLNRLLSQARIPLTVYPGAEVSFSLSPDIMPEYTLNRSRYILMEFPHNHLPSLAGNMLAWLMTKGLKPIIAHPERNLSVIRSPELLLNLLNDNISVQITAGSVTGDFGIDIQYCTNYLLDSKRVDFIASDAHSGKLRPPILSRAAQLIAERLSIDAANRLALENPEIVLSGEKTLSPV